MRLDAIDENRHGPDTLSFHGAHKLADVRLGRDHMLPTCTPAPARSQLPAMGRETAQNLDAFVLGMKTPNLEILSAEYGCIACT